MQDEALQAAFEIKTECDEISRRLLRWHWEQKPGSHSLDALLRQRQRHQRPRKYRTPAGGRAGCAASGCETPYRPPKRRERRLNSCLLYTSRWEMSASQPSIFPRSWAKQPNNATAWPQWPPVI